VNCVSSWNYKQQNINVMHGPMNIKDMGMIYMKYVTICPYCDVLVQYTYIKIFIHQLMHK
jgi:hypothetical protein